MEGVIMTDTASEKQVILDTILDMTAVSIERAGLSSRDVMLVRLAALAAVDAPPASYLVNLNAAASTGLTFEEVRGVLVALAPVIGTPRVTAAAGAIATSLGYALALDEAIDDAVRHGEDASDS
ncbi:MAG TPA: carboxymuconolactone decarboxylase family protein [Kineosporiaceae bacterium]|nr:carboxymuconolactone decarboxylase family protein [Kineosporiaceae bacterium]